MSAIAATLAAQLAGSLPVGLLASEGAEETRALPMPPATYGLIAMGFFLVCLALVWSFRNTANKVPKRHTPPLGPQHPGHEHRYADPPSGSHN